MVITPPCLVCGSPSTRIELVMPGELPAGWKQWDSDRQGFFLLHRDPGQWHLIFKGIATENGNTGDPIEASRAELITQAFQPPLSYAQVHTAGFYDDAGFCQDCDAPYCYRHWHVSENRLRLLPPRPRQESGPVLVTFPVSDPLDAN